MPWAIGVLVGVVDGIVLGAGGGALVGGASGGVLIGGASGGVPELEFANESLVLDKIYELYPKHAKDETISIHSKNVKFFILSAWRTFSV